MPQLSARNGVSQEVATPLRLPDSSEFGTFPTPPSRTRRAPFKATGFCGLHRTLWVLFIFPCPPSPCPGHSPRRLSTTRTLSPCGSRRVGDPQVSRSTCVVVRSLHSPDSPHHLRVATAGGLLRQRACLTQSAVYVLSYHADIGPEQDRSVGVRAV